MNLCWRKGKLFHCNELCLFSSQKKKTHTQKNDGVQDHAAKISVNDDDNFVEIYTKWYYWVIKLECTTDLKDEAMGKLEPPTSDKHKKSALYSDS